MSSEPQIHYLPDDPETGRWGLRLTAGGQARLAPGTPYPAPGHPGSHRFQWERGRVLREFQFVLITAGAGIYQDRDGTRDITAGHGFLLVPGRWHRYRPDPATGWEERWIACDGPAVRRLHDQGRLDPGAAGWHRPLPAPVPGRLAEILALLHHRPPGWRAESEALAGSILARIAAGNDQDDQPLQRAAGRLASDLQVAIETVAREAGLSPAQFRVRFRAVHGCSPRRYRQEALLAQARRLLAVPGTTVAEVAAALGFSAHAHFTRGFRRAGGESPRTWRARETGAVMPEAVMPADD